MKKIIILVIAILGLNYTAYSQGASCAASEVLCNPNTTFPGSTGGSGGGGVGVDYGCLSSQPGPAWYTINVATSGDITLTMTNSGGFDIDFALWGPFTTADVCGAAMGAPTSCDYTTAPGGTINLVGATQGQWYKLIVANFSGSPTNISMTQTAGTGGLGGPLAFSATGAGPFFSTDAAVVLGTSPPASDPNVSITSITGTGVTNTSTGDFDPAVAGIGTHTITLVGTSYGCPVTTTSDIVVSAPPEIVNNDADGDGTPDITDPCSCTDPLNPDPLVVMGPGGGEVFHEVVTVNSGAGETWNMTAATIGALDATGAPLAIPAAMTEISPGVYTIDFYHEITTGYTGEFNNGTSTLNIANSCTVSCLSTVPTLGEWGLVIFALLMLNMVVLFVINRRKRTELAFS